MKLGSASKLIGTRLAWSGLAGAAALAAWAALGLPLAALGGLRLAVAGGLAVAGLAAAAVGSLPLGFVFAVGLAAASPVKPASAYPALGGCLALAAYLLCVRAAWLAGRRGTEERRGERGSGRSSVLARRTAVLVGVQAVYLLLGLGLVALAVQWEAAMGTRFPLPASVGYHTWALVAAGAILVALALAALYLRDISEIGLLSEDERTAGLVAWWTRFWTGSLAEIEALAEKLAGYFGPDPAATARKLKVGVGRLLLIAVALVGLGLYLRFGRAAALSEAELGSQPFWAGLRSALEHVVLWLDGMAAGIAEFLRSIGGIAP